MPSTSPAITKITPNIAKHPFISATGAKGYLQWLQTDPVMAKVYARIRPQLVTMISTGQLPLGTGSGASAPPGNLGYLGACCAAYCVAAFCTNTATATCAAATGQSTVSTSDVVSNAAPTTGSASTSWLSSLSSLISGAGQAALTVDQISTANQANAIQLARAKAGQSPLNLSAYGISTTPGFNLGLSSSTLGTIILVAGLGVVGLMMLKKR
jgi:hypothetical protein